jgi:hypothetical protein
MTLAVSARIITDAEETPVVTTTAKPAQATAPAPDDPGRLPVLASPQPMREHIRRQAR